MVIYTYVFTRTIYRSDFYQVAIICKWKNKQQKNNRYNELL